MLSHICICLRKWFSPFQFLRHVLKAYHQTDIQQQTTVMWAPEFLFRAVGRHRRGPGPAVPPLAPGAHAVPQPAFPASPPLALGVCFSTSVFSICLFGTSASPDCINVCNDEVYVKTKLLIPIGLKNGPAAFNVLQYVFSHGVCGLYCWNGVHIFNILPQGIKEKEAYTIFDSKYPC